MIRRLIGRHRSATVTTGVSVLVGALVAGAALVSTGYHAQRLDLGDGTVWVPSAQYGAVGRANTQVLELNTAVETSSDALSVVQRGATVFAVDTTKGTVAKVNVADATVGDAVTLPSGSPEVFLAGRAAIIGNGDTGELWTTPAAELDAFDASTKADLTLGADAVFDASDDHVAVYSPRTSTASLVSLGATPAVERKWTVRADRRHDLQVAAVGAHVAVLDRTDGSLSVDGRAVDLGGRVGSDPALQRSSDDGDAVVVAGAAGTVRVTPSGTVSATPLVVSGRAARPLVEGSCTYAVWSGGQGMDSCDGRALQDLDQVPGGAALRIEHNGGTVVANDPASGRTWAVARSGQLIDNWADLVDRDDDQQQERASDDDVEVEKDQEPPVAVDDDLGARPGRTTTLPVLLNDYDPNGDPLVISDVGSVDGAVGTIAVVRDAQQLQVTVRDSASGTVSFPYTITDGNGGTASATVRVEVRPDSVNESPRQVRDTGADVVQGGNVSTNVLSDWVDPDGDPVFLASASASDGDRVSTTPDGVLDFRNASGRTGERVQQIVVSDGRDEGRGSVTVHVATQGNVRLIADAFAVGGYTAEPFTVEPLDHVRGGNGTVSLTSVSTSSGLTVTPSYDAGTFRVVGTTAGDHQLEYTVTDGTKTASGVVRVTVVAPPDASTAPITTPKTVFVNTLSTKDTDVTATDIDPAGGVLLVTGIDAPPASSGAQASVLDQHIVRVTLTAPLDGPVSFRYTESNGLATATGTVTVVEIPRPDRIQPPVAQADTATVRVGDVADIDVLDNDTQPEGEPLTVLPDLVQNVPGDGGLLFVSGDHLRYLAPTTPGSYTAAYRVAGPDGQTADASVSISVRERDAATNSAPAPKTVTARVVAGQSVSIPVPLNAIDPDGDSVQLIGVASNPDKGSVTDVTDNALSYQAGDYSAGTDEFTYTVVDALGARATGTVRVGIAPRAEQAANPIAQADHVTIRPGGSVTVRVLQNDSDPEGGRLTVSAATPTDDAVTAKVVGRQQIRVTPPRSATRGDFAVLYTASNRSGGSTTAFLTVAVDRDAQPLRPEVDDTTLDLQDVLHRQTVTVDVLRNVFFAEGTRADLRVAVVAGHGAGATVTADDRVLVRLSDTSQVIPFSVARRDHPDVVSYGFIHVPGFDDALPQVNRTAPAITVQSEGTVQIPLSDYVVTANGRTATVTDRGSVKATHANGASLVADPSTLQFASAKLYYGNASISFEVTDGSRADGGHGRVATLVLPITVTPRSNQPPAFTGSSIDMQPGDRRTLDLTKLTDYPYPRDLPELRWSIVGRPGAGTTASVSGQRLTVAVDDTAVKGSTSTIGVAVVDGSGQGRPGRVVVSVVTSTRPLVQPAPDQAVVTRGSSATIDVLANDRPTNPFPGQALRVVDIRGLSGGVPSGVSITPSADRSRLRVSVAAGARPADTHVQYQVADATGDPARAVWGDVTIAVQDVPDAPGTPVRTGANVGGQVTLSWSSPQANNAPITAYRVTGTNGLVKDCGAATVCTVTGLDPAATYRFSVQATNAVGRSDPSPQSASMSADYVPAAPGGIAVTADETTPNQVDVRWDAVPRPNGGSAVRTYVVSVTGPGLSGAKQTGTTTSTTFGGAVSGATYTVTVSAHNDADRDGNRVEWNTGTGTGTAVGTPAPPSSVRASAGSAPGNDGRSVVTVSWGPADAQGGRGPGYSVHRVPTGSSPSCTSLAGQSSLGSQSGTVDSSVGGGGARYAVVADNGYFCSVDYADAVTYERPSGTAAPTLSLVPGASGGQYDVRVVVPTENVDHYAFDTGSGTIALSPGAARVIVPGGGARNTVGQLALRACGSPGSAFCTTPSQSWTGSAAAFDLTATVTAAEADHPITVQGPSGTAVASVRYTATWFADTSGTVPVLTHLSDTWDANQGAPSPPAFARSVRVTAKVDSAVDGTTLSGTASDAFVITQAPQPAPNDPAPTQPDPGQPDPGQPDPGQPDPGQPDPGQPTTP